MQHAIHRVVGFTLVGDHTLSVDFADGSTQVIDFEPVLHGELFSPLRDPSFFAKVRVDEVAHTLLWPNGADFDPATLHDWPRLGGAMAKAAERWAVVSG